MNHQSTNIPELSQHARLRMAQRNLTESHIQFVLNYGERYHRGNALHVYLRHRDIPNKYRKNRSLSKLEGVAIILDRDASTVITLWRNRKDGLKQIKRKGNYGW